MGGLLTSNIAAIRGQRLLGNAVAEQQRSSERLASGLRINRASEDAAGLAVASDLNVRTRVYSQSIRNVSDAVSLLNITEGALSELESVTLRQRELVEQAANGVYDTRQRSALNDEARALTHEYNRIIATTQFNNIGVYRNGPSALQIQLGFGTEESLQVALGDALSRSVGDGTFQAGVTQATDGSRSAIADFNNDGNLDYVRSRTFNANARVMLGDGTGQFTDGFSFNAVGQGSLGTGDFNGDGNADVMAFDRASGEVYVFLGTGTGSFGSTLTIATQAGTQDGHIPSIGDINNDGYDDILYSNVNGAGFAYLIRGSAAGPTSAELVGTTVGTGSNRVNTAMGDFNNDGVGDFVLTGSPGAGGETKVYFGTAEGSFQVGYSSTAVVGQYLAAADFNNDGNTDIFLSNASANGFQILLNDGAGGFSASVASPLVGPTVGGVNVLDANGDGNSDILIAESALRLFMGNGDGTFSGPVTIATSGTSQSFINIADFNKDGADDFLTGFPSTGQLLLYRGNARQTTTINTVNLLTRASALTALDTLEANAQRIRLERGTIGAAQGRLDVALGLLRVTRENLHAARSAIEDADIATETANYTRTQILKEIGSAVLAQVNQSSRVALDLLQIDRPTP